MSADLQITSVIGANGQPLPIHGTGIGSNWSAPVKQERADEAEIAELAAKMMETQKAALAKQQQQAAQLASRQGAAGGGNMQAPMVNANGQTNILNYMSRPQKPTNGTAASANGRSGGANGTAAAAAAGTSTDDKKSPCDEESQKGRFGWTTFGKTYIPYIYRAQEKYCSVRMIELKLLGKYLNCLHPDIYSSCTCVRSYYITEAEARLLIEINHKHCDGEFGRDMFTPKDLVVRLADATKFYQFLDICYRKLISGSKSPSEKCGFIRINKESVVPYTVCAQEQVVPLFYFEGETENLKAKANFLCGWDLAYLKFCCKVQGIRNELFSSENVAVISLTDIKSYFPNGTEFEDYWPSKVVDSNLLIGATNRPNAHSAAAVNWTRQPSQPPPKVVGVGVVGGGGAGGAASSQQTANMAQQQKQTHAAAAAAAAAAAQQQQASLLKQQQQQQQQQQRGGGQSGGGAFGGSPASMQQPGRGGGQSGSMHSNAALATVQALTNGLSNGSWMSQQQNNLPLIHAQMMSQAQQSHPSSRGQYRNPMENLILNNRQSPYTYNNTAISMQPVNNHAQGNAPPPLVRSAGGQNTNHMSTNHVEQTLLQQQTQQQQQRHNSAPTHAYSPSSASSATSSTSIHLAHHLKSPHSNSAAANSFNLPSSPAPAFTANAAPPPSPDYSNLAFWNQLTPTQRLLLTQQIKSQSTPLGVAATSSLNKAAFPALPSLPLDTDLKTMLDYNPHKARARANGQFTKPSVPPLIPVNVAEVVQGVKRGASASLNAAPRSAYSNSGGGAFSASSGATGAAPLSTVPLNSSADLENFEKKFKMTDEMKAVVQKVLSNPDLSTFIQTNATQQQSSFVPFISPPISPATGGGTSVSIVPNPNVTITPTPPQQYGGASGGGSAHNHNSYLQRQKSVICSTSAAAAAISGIPSPSSITSNSTATPTPSPTRSSSKLGGSGHFSSRHQQLNHHNSPSTSASAYHHHAHSNHSQQQQHPPSSPSAYSHSHHHPHTLQHHNQHTPTPPMEVIDLSSPRRLQQAASVYLQQAQQQAQQHVHQAAAVAAAQQQQQQRLAAVAAAAQHHSQQQNGSRSSSNSSSAAAAAAASNSASMHLQRHAAMAANAAAAAGGGDSSSSASSQRLCIIPEIPANNLNVQPYKVQKVYVDNHLVPCINMKAYNDSDQLMTLTDFQKYFFPSVPLEHCKRLIEALGVELYKGNRRQIQILMENDRTHNENMPLVQVRDIIKYMTQLTFMIRNQEQPPSKRARIS